MGWSKIAWVAALLGLVVIGFAADASAQGWRGTCRKGDLIKIQDLDMTPDPIVQGQRIRSWRVRVRLEGNRACETEIEIREGNDLVGRARYNLRPGVNEVQVGPAEGYR